MLDIGLLLLFHQIAQREAHSLRFAEIRGLLHHRGPVLNLRLGRSTSLFARSSLGQRPGLPSHQGPGHRPFLPPRLVSQICLSHILVMDLLQGPLTDEFLDDFLDLHLMLFLQHLLGASSHTVWDPSVGLAM